MSEVNAARGAELRALRESCGLSGVAAPAGAGRLQSKLSRVETGRFGASLTEVADLLDLYGAPEEVRAELLARVARWDGPALGPGSSVRAAPVAVRPRSVRSSPG